MALEALAVPIGLGLPREPCGLGLGPRHDRSADVRLEAQVDVHHAQGIVIAASAPSRPLTFRQAEALLRGELDRARLVAQHVHGCFLRNRDQLSGGTRRGRLRLSDLRGLIE